MPERDDERMTEFETCNEQRKSSMLYGKKIPLLKDTKGAEGY